MGLTIEKVLRGRNCEGEIYLCDVMEYFEIKDFGKGRELRDKLNEVSKGMEQS